MPIRYEAGLIKMLPFPAERRSLGDHWAVSEAIPDQKEARRAILWKWVYEGGALKCQKLYLIFIQSAIANKDHLQQTKHQILIPTSQSTINFGSSQTLCNFRDRRCHHFKRQEILFQLLHRSICRLCEAGLYFGPCIILKLMGSLCCKKNENIRIRALIIVILLRV